MIVTIADLQQSPNWVVFDQEPQPAGKKPKKIPYTPGTNQRAKVNDPATWRTHAEAAADAERTGRHPGVAITPSMNLTLIDIDGRTESDAIAALDSYTERSINGGLHILVAGRPPAGFKTRPGEEVHPRDGNRFALITGDIIAGRDTIEVRTDRLAERYPAPAPRPIAPLRELDADDQTIIERVLRMPKGRQLHSVGDTTGYPSGSEADLALLNCYTAAGATPDQLDGLYRQSALYPERQKRWDDARYRERTITKALDGYVVPFEDWQRSKLGTVTGKPQDAGLVATPADTDRVAELERIVAAQAAEIAALTRRLDAAERRAETLSHLQHRTKNIIQNKNLGQERFTAIALSHRFAHLESVGDPGENGLYPITVASVAETAGVSEDAAAKHIGKLVEHGIVRKEVRWVAEEHVNPKTGEIRTGYKRQYIGPAHGTVIDFVDRVATLQPEKPKTWGGRADRCRPCSKHPNAGVVKRVTFHCAECDQELGRLPDEPVGPKPQDAGFVSGETPAPSRDAVATPLLCRDAPVSHNDAEGTIVAAAWLKGQSLPGMESPLPDPYAEYAPGAD